MGRRNGRTRGLIAQFAVRLGSSRSWNVTASVIVVVIELLGLANGRSMTCAKVKSITEQHMADIRRRVKELRRLESDFEWHARAVSGRRDVGLSDP